MNAPARLPRPADRLSLGTTGVEVSPICLGLTVHPDTYLAAFDAGFNFFFLTGDLHWPIYEPSRVALARLLERKGVRDQIAVAVAVYAARREFYPAAVGEVIAAVPGLGRIDVIVLGGVAGSDLNERAGIGHDMREQRVLGTRAVGATFHERAAVPVGYNQGLVDLAFTRYNPIHPGARTDVVPKLVDGAPARLFNFKNVYGLPPEERWAKLGLTDEHWRPDPTDYYRFALSLPKMDGTLCALTQPHEIGEMCAALERGPLDDEEQQYLIDLALLETGQAELAEQQP